VKCSSLVSHVVNGVPNYIGKFTLLSFLFLSHFNTTKLMTDTIEEQQRNNSIFSEVVEVLILYRAPNIVIP
jgi:hypothetical protein